MNKLVGKLVLISFFLFIVLYGAWAAGVVLREPDICFLLAGGRDIVQHGQLPYTDPFAYTLTDPVIVQQWLTEVVFYLVYATTTGVGLLVMDAAVLCLTFVVMPYRICRLNGIGPAKALGVAVLAALSSMSHLSVRPELFSCLLIACFLELLARLDRAEGSDKSRINWLFVAAFAGLMILWVNMHSLFIAGPLLIGFYAACRLIERFVFKLETRVNPTIFVALAGSVLAIGVNPYATRLIAYLSTFFLPYASGTLKLRANEMAPITLGSLQNPLFYPFFVMCALGLFALVKHGLAKPQKPGDLFFKLIIPGGIVGGFKTVRTIPISALLLAAGTANIWSRQVAVEKPLDAQLKEMCNLPVFAPTCVVFAALGAYLMTNIIPPEFPQGSTAFKPPMGAIAYIEKSPPPGKVLNDPHFGDVLMWQMKDAPKLFFDSRYYLFGQDLIDEYWTMVMCRDDWKERMDHYGFDWVFIPADLKLAQALSNDPNWKVLYADKFSVIISRVNAPELKR